MSGAGGIESGALEDLIGASEVSKGVVRASRISKGPDLFDSKRFS